MSSDDFVDWIYEHFLSREMLDRSELAGVKELRTGPGTVEEIARRVPQEFGLEEEKLYKRRRVPQAWSILMELCRLYLAEKMSLAEIGRKPEGVSGSASSQNQKRLKASLGKNPFLRKSFQRLAEGMMSKLSQ